MSFQPTQGDRFDLNVLRKEKTYLEGAFRDPVRGPNGSLPSADPVRGILGLARRLAQDHFQVDPSIEHIALFSLDEDTAMRLVEVSPEASVLGEVDPFGFDPSRDYPVMILIADVVPSQWEEIRSGRMPLPDGWTKEPTAQWMRG